MKTRPVDRIEKPAVRLVNEQASIREEFCKKWFLGGEILPGLAWVDIVGLKQMTCDRIARLEIEAPETFGCFSGIQVKVISKTKGLIDHKWFAFRDWLRERQDARPDYEHPPHIWTSGGSKFDWYISVPSASAVRVLMAAIAFYISSFEIRQ